MDRGQSISYDNMKGSWTIYGSSKNCTNWIEEVSVSAPSGTYYISAPVWSLHIYAHAEGLRTNKVTCKIYKWESGDSFTHVKTLEVEGGMGSSDENEYYSHNNTEYSNRDISNNHLWKLEVSCSDNGWVGTNTRTFSFSYGNVGVSKNSNSDTHLSNYLVYACECNYREKGSRDLQHGFTGEDADYISGYWRGVFRGEPIDTTNGYMCYTEG